MSLDIYRLADKKREERLYSLDEQTVNYLSGIFSEFKRKTGVDIDLYADNRIYCDHLRIISSLISSNKDANKHVLAFKKFLDNEIQKQEDLLMVGD